MYRLSKRSLGNIEGIDPRLILLVGLMLDKSKYDFIVTEGLRTMERQKKLVAEGKSKTMNSKHLIGSAFDVAMLDENGNVTWEVEPYYRDFTNEIKKLAKHLGFDITCGIDWGWDAPHIQIND